jgi:hypothetical protein
MQPVLRLPQQQQRQQGPQHRPLLLAQPKAFERQRQAVPQQQQRPLHQESLQLALHRVSQHQGLPLAVPPGLLLLLLLLLGAPQMAAQQQVAAQA